MWLLFTEYLPKSKSILLWMWDGILFIMGEEKQWKYPFSNVLRDRLNVEREQLERRGEEEGASVSGLF